jgi:L-fuculose-phosphate aldolase
MCDIGRRLWQRGLVGAAEGNISCRLSPQRILCTPQGASKGHMRPDELVIIDTKGNAVDGKVPSSEIKLHVRMYQKRPDCQAVVHAHPTVATGFALAGEDIPDDLLPESGYVLGSVAMVPFAYPGTDEVPDSIESLLADHKTFLLMNHGAVTMGKDLVDAYHRMETLERIARVILAARLIGNPQPMPENAFKKILGTLNGEL